MFSIDYLFYLSLIVNVSCLFYFLLITIRAFGMISCLLSGVYEVLRCLWCELNWFDMFVAGLVVWCFA